MSKLIIDAFTHQALWAIKYPNSISLHAKQVDILPKVVKIELNLEGVYYVITKLMKKQYAGGRPAVLKHLAMLTRVGTLTRNENGQETTWTLMVDVSQSQNQGAVS
jgi:hypothetical protein